MLTGLRDLVRYTHATAIVGDILKIRARDIGLGDMAIVGPRPLPLDEVRVDTQDQRMRFGIKPGITCLWQVCGRTEIPYDEWLALDLWYIRNRSLSLDLQIIVKTIPAVLSARGAY